MHKTIFLLLSIIASVPLLAQDYDYVIAYGKFKIEWGNTNNSSITVYRDGSLLEKQGASKNGKFEFELELNHLYLFEFTKPAYVSKRVEFNTKVPANILESADFEPFPDFDFHVTLFKVYPEVDTMFFVNPVGKIQYSAEINDFDWDKDYTLEILKKLEAIENEIKEKHQQEMENKALAQSNKPEPVNGKPPGAEKTKPLANKKTAATKKNRQQLTVPETVSANQNRPIPAPKEIKKQASKKQNTTKNKQIETLELNGKTITRISMTKNQLATIYLKVQHKWGGTFYFIERSDGSLQNISQSIFRVSTQ